MIKAGFTEGEMPTKLQRISKDSLVPTDCQLTSRVSTGREATYFLKPETSPNLRGRPPKGLFFAGSLSPSK